MTEPEPGILARYGGVPVITSPHAMETVYRFPKSENRSRRLHKKLTRRFGDQIFQRPCAFMMSGKMFAHPEIIKAMAEDQRIVRVSNVGNF